MRAPFLLLLATSCATSGGSGPDGTGPASGDAVDEDAVKQRDGAGRIEGVVIDPATASPVTLATVTLANPKDSEVLSDSVTDVSGKYSFSNVEPGTYRVIVAHGALENETLGVVVLADRTTTLKHDLSSFRRADGSDRETKSAIESDLGSITGRVLDGARGEPFAGVTIEVAAKHLSESIFTIANESGRFDVRNLKPGTYVVSAYYSLVDKGNVEIRRSGVVVERGVATELTLEIDTEAR